LIKIEALLSSEVFRGGESSFDEPLDEDSDEFCDEENVNLMKNCHVLKKSNQFQINVVDLIDFAS
jgi:hypothetical protein